MERIIFVVAATALSMVSMAVETNTHYTVTVDGGTYDSPVSLDTVNVTVETVGEPALERPFSEVCADFGAGPAIFRKRGKGWMMSSTKMAEFTGEIRIEEGAFMVNTNLMTGPLDLATAPTVVVSNGASFALAATDETCPSAGGSAGPNLHLKNAFRLVGEGVDGYGSIANLLGNTQQYLFYGTWSLDGDTLLSGRSSQRYDVSDEPFIYLNGHTMTVKRGDGMPWWNLCLGSAQVCDGHVVVDSTGLLVQGGRLDRHSVWRGDERNTLTITNRATLLFYNNFVSIPWSVRFCEGTSFTSGGTAVESCRSDVGHTNVCNYLSGPVVIDGRVDLFGRYDYAGFTIPRILSGSGPVNVNGAWLNLVSPSSGYLGAISIDSWNSVYGGVRYPAGLALYSPGAYDENASGVTLTNAEVRLMTDERYCLPAVAFNVSSGTNFAFSGGGYGNTCASLRKDGGGTLDLLSNVSVTGRFELAEGTLRFSPMRKYYSTVGGLWKCMVPQDDRDEENPSTNHRPFMNFGDTSYYSNEVATCCDMLKTPTYPPWEKFTSVAWGGYVWNRSPTNEMWRFAASISGYSRLYIDGEMVIVTDDNQNVLFANVMMAPGCHEFLFKVNPRLYGHPGSTSQPSKNRDWKAGTPGLMVSKTSVASTNSDDFVFLEDFCSYTNVSAGGVGYIFTRDARDVGEFDPAALAELSAMERPVANMVCNPGTAIDLGDGNETPLFIGTLEGVTAVRNGGVKIGKSWKLDANRLKAGGALSVEGTLAFAGGCTLDWEDLPLLPRTNDYVIAVAAGGIEGLPIWSPADGTHNSRWHLAKEKNADGDDALTFRWRAGMIVLMR